MYHMWYIMQLTYLVSKLFIKQWRETRIKNLTNENIDRRYIVNIFKVIGVTPNILSIYTFFNLKKSKDVRLTKFLWDD